MAKMLLSVLNRLWWEGFMPVLEGIACPQEIAASKWSVFLEVAPLLESQADTQCLGLPLTILD